MSPLRFHGAARRELLDAADRYEALARRGREFRLAVEQTLASIAAHPAAGAPHHEGTRRAIVPRFPYTLVYAEEAGRLWVVAVAHQRRRDGYWLRRLPPP